jgi:riboflavin kinase/FMN adenylyltransferase
MRVTSLPDAETRARRVAVGTFDGVHLGHREVIRGADTVLTFEPHPLVVIHPEATPKLLDSFSVKRDLIASLGVEELVIVPFDREFAGRGHDEFVDGVLIERLSAMSVAVGENFRFGRAARGDTEYLRSRSEFETRVVSLVEVDGETVSSSHVRALVAAGEVDVATRFLGAPFTLEGEVVAGDRRGRTMGMPTAHLVPDESELDPQWLEGCYTVGVSSGASAPEVLVDRLLERLAGLGYTDVETREVTTEDVTFSLPPWRRQDTA